MFCSFFNIDNTLKSFNEYTRSKCINIGCQSFIGFNSKILVEFCKLVKFKFELKKELNSTKLIKYNLL